MVLQVLTIALLFAAVIAFLLLWYFWLKGKLGASFFLDHDDQVLFPFRYFSWILLGVIVATCLAQIHFVRVAATVHERMTGLSDAFQRVEQQAKAADNVKDSIQKLRRDMEGSFQGLRSQLNEMHARSVSAHQVAEAPPVAAAPTRKPMMAGLASVKDETGQRAFSSEARAARPPAGPASARPTPAAEPLTQDTPTTMPLSRQGRITTDSLRVRKQPQQSSEVVEKLTTGQVVKVTEKRQTTDTMWFRVVTPAGKTGWVDYRFIKLEGNS